VYPDRTFQFEPIQLTDEGLFSVKVQLKTKQSVWSDRCAVHFTVVCRFAGEEVIGLEVEPFSSHPNELGGVLALTPAPEVIHLRPIARTD
jgi:hypothetical protein